MSRPHAYFFGYVSKVLAKVSDSNAFVVKGHVAYLDSGLLGGLGDFIVTTGDGDSALKPTVEIVEGTLVTCAIDEEGGKLRLVSAMRPDGIGDST